MEAVRRHGKKEHEVDNVLNLCISFKHFEYGLNKSVPNLILIFELAS